MNNTLVVGVTGGIGSGKSTVCRIFEQFDIPVYYADDRAKALLLSDPQLKSDIIQFFGEESYLPDGALNRVYLAERVFKVDSELERLNSLVHPAVAIDFDNWVSSQTSKIVLKEAALLIENDSYKKLDFLIAVLAPEKLRIERVLLRDVQRSASQIREILAKQVDDNLRKSVSNLTIMNDGKNLLLPQVLKAHAQLQELALEKVGSAI